MSTTLYFAKLNLATDEIYNIYNDPKRKQALKFALIQSLQKEGIWIKEDVFFDDNGMPQVTKIEYKMHILTVDGDFTHVEGWIYKESLLHYKTLENNNELAPRSVKNTEAIRFYFDLEHEIIGYSKKPRFGYKEFMEAFVTILNDGLNTSELPLFFTISQCTKGLDLSDIKEGLKGISQIKELQISIQPPNPNRKLLEELQSLGEGELANMKTANVTQMSILFSSSGDSGLNLDADLIDGELNKLQGIHSKLTVEEATKNGYVRVNATSKTGRRFSSEDKLPFRKVISSPGEFIEACKDAILELLA